MVAWVTRAFQTEVGYKSVAYSVVVSNPDGTDVTPLTYNTELDPYQDVAASWSPDGNRLALTVCASGLFGCNFGVRVDLINSDGSGRTQWLANASSPVWSPDGTKLLYLGNPHYDSGTWSALHVRAVSGGESTVLQIGDCIGFGGPLWKATPEGERIFFVGRCWANGLQPAVYRANPDGSGLTKLLDLTTELPNHSVAMDGMSISPDATKLLYGWCSVPANDPCNFDIVERTLSSGASRAVRATPAYEAVPVHSPSGDRILFAGPPSPPNIFRDIYVADASDGSGMVRLTDNGVDDQPAAWQPCVSGVTVRCGPPERPDSDGDGIRDFADDCPSQPGPAEYNGCPPPDGDGDGVPDGADACPLAPGPASNGGCPPDGDGDSVPDGQDACPLAPGPASNGGCPLPGPVDGDGDGVPDAVDACPTTPGPAANAGCPLGTTPADADRDGTPDASDACPTIPGPATNAGCPVGTAPPDADGDGVPDAADACPGSPGARENHGCNPGVVPPPPVPATATDGADSDGDGLSDGAEARGVDVDRDGRADIDLAAMGAKVAHMDLFVELDAMPGHVLDPAAVERLISSFAAAPVSNPDGRPGVTLHLDHGPRSVMDPPTGARWEARSEFDLIAHASMLGQERDGEYDWTAFDRVRRFSAVRRAVFRYGISAHDFSAQGYSGIARGIPGREFLVTLGSACPPPLECSGAPLQQAGTTMHEAGHSLGLRHGGSDDINDKPDYRSVMNYLFQFSLIDYSRGEPFFDWPALNFNGGLGGLGAPVTTPVSDDVSVRELARRARRTSGDRRPPTIAASVQRRGASTRLRVRARDNRRLALLIVAIDRRQRSIRAKGKAAATTVRLRRGRHHVDAIAFDAAGNRSPTKSITARVR
jgi:hypothetical protein